MNTTINVLDHGFIRLVDTMGDDTSVVEAARVSYGTGTKTPSDDRSLIRYLMRHRHTTPFEMCEIKLHIKAPLFVARQWMRHRTASINELSARYSLVGNYSYTPDLLQVCTASPTNKQGRGFPLSREEAQQFREDTDGHSRASWDLYYKSLDSGVSRELARINTPLSFYTEFYWKINLHNLLHFLELRADSHAQYEIRVYAEAILGVVEQWVPVTYQAFLDYRMNAVTLSAREIATLASLLSGEVPTQEDSGLSVREWKDFQEFYHKLLGA